jgi:hypothetical protein
MVPPPVLFLVIGDARITTATIAEGTLNLQSSFISVEGTCQGEKRRGPLAAIAD